MQAKLRFTYDNGTLEIALPLEGHERFARLIELFILSLRRRPLRPFFDRLRLSVLCGLR